MKKMIFKSAFTISIILIILYSIFILNVNHFFVFGVVAVLSPFIQKYMIFKDLFSFIERKQLVLYAKKVY